MTMISMVAKRCCGYWAVPSRLQAPEDLPGAWIRKPWCETSLSSTILLDCPSICRPQFSSVLLGTGIFASQGLQQQPTRRVDVLLPSFSWSFLLKGTSIVRCVHRTLLIAAIGVSSIAQTSLPLWPQRVRSRANTLAIVKCCPMLEASIEKIGRHAVDMCHVLHAVLA